MEPKGEFGPGAREPCAFSGQGLPVWYWVLRGAGSGASGIFLYSVYTWEKKDDSKDLPGLRGTLRGKNEN